VPTTLNGFKGGCGQGHAQSERYPVLREKANANRPGYFILLARSGALIRDIQAIQGSGTVPLSANLLILCGSCGPSPPTTAFVRVWPGAPLLTRQIGPQPHHQSTNPVAPRKTARPQTARPPLPRLIGAGSRLRRQAAPRSATAVRRARGGSGSRHDRDRLAHERAEWDHAGAGAVVNAEAPQSITGPLWAICPARIRYRTAANPTRGWQTQRRNRRTCQGYKLWA
jgi:hypothetical protein